MIRRLTVLEFNDVALPLLQATIGKAADYSIEPYGNDQDDLVDSWGYYEENILVGVISLGSALHGVGRYNLGYFAVNPKYQRNGVGQKLLNFLFDELKRRYIGTLLVETYSNEKFLAARSFYEKNGFVKVGEIDEFLRDGTSAVYYLKHLVVN